MLKDWRSIFPLYQAVCQRKEEAAAGYVGHPCVDIGNESKSPTLRLSVAAVPLNVLVAGISSSMASISSAAFPLDCGFARCLAVFVQKLLSQCSVQRTALLVPFFHEAS